MKEMKKMKKTLYSIAVLFIVAMIAVPAVAAVASGADETEDTDTFVPYIDQLDANRRAIYDALEAAAPDARVIKVVFPIALTAKSNTPGEAKKYLEDELRSIVNDSYKALRLCAPLAYWGWEPSHVVYDKEIQETGNTATLASITLRLSTVNYPTDPKTGEFQGIQAMLDDIEAYLSKVKIEGKTEYEKVLEINNFITKTAVYDPNGGITDKESIYAHDVYGVFVDRNHYAVCDGYSKAFLLLCEREGIESVVVFGTSTKDRVNHAWNYVKVDGEWYGMDVTWNDNSNNSNSYFLKGADTFFTTHQQGVFLLDGLIPYPFNSPVLSATAYELQSGEADYEIITWVLAAAIVGIIVVALYRHARGSK
jgi:hypothetical protein